MDEENLILEARQKKAQQVYGNGDWNTKLLKPIKINNNDVFQINKAFCDTQAQTDQKVIIEDEVGQITLEFKNYIYHTNNAVADKIYTDATTLNDGKDYIWASSKNAGTVPADEHTVQKIKLEYEGYGSSGDGYWGDPDYPSNPIKLDYNYYDSDNTTILKGHYYLPVPRQELYYRMPDTFIQTLNVMITAIDGSIKKSPSDPNWVKCKCANPTVEGTKLTPVNVVLTPYITSTYVVINSGAYPPEEICTIINDALTTNKNFNKNFKEGDLAETNFLSQSKLQKDTPADEKDYYVQANDGKQLIRWDRSQTPGGDDRPNYWIGANQIELDWDSSSNRFFWKFLHAPLYSSGGTIQSSIGKDASQGNVATPYFQMGKNGGIFWNSLTGLCTDATKPRFNQPYPFFEERLGFNTSHLCRSHEIIPSQPIGGGNFQSFNFVNYGNGLCTTSARPDIDALIVKNSYQYVFNDLTKIKSDNDLTTEIYAEESVLDGLVLNYGYFLIEVQGIFNTEIIGEDYVSQNISAILNRYYSLGAYTSGDSSSSLTYKHRGDPIYLSALKIRILDSDRNLANTIGEDNTIFFDIIRGNPQTLTPMIQQLQIKEEQKEQKMIKN